jgi:phosphoserine phosphatase RsbX
MIDWAWAGSALQVDSGDLHVVAPFTGGVLLALIDGLGHGTEAAIAARAAAAVLEARPADPLENLLRECHAGLRKTRGAAMTLASLTASDGALSWTGIGNVDAVLVRATQGAPHMGVTMRGGVVGYQMPSVRIETLHLTPGDTLVFATDGVSSHFSEAVSTVLSPSMIAEAIRARYFKGTDDAHTLVVRYCGETP